MLRVLIGEADATAPSHTVVVIEAEIDDMNPQIFGVLMDRLLAEGALDVFYTPIQMKKNRPGHAAHRDRARPMRAKRSPATIFRETTTIGVRYREMTRECLDRETVTVTTSVGAVRIKVARAERADPERRRPSSTTACGWPREHDVPVKDVQALAMKALLDAGNREL